MTFQAAFAAGSGTMKIAPSNDKASVSSLHGLIIWTRYGQPVALDGCLLIRPAPRRAVCELPRGLRR